MKKIKKKQILSLVYIFHLVIALLVVADPSMVKAAENVSLYSATSFGVLAGSTITNTGPTTINGTAGGDVGLHPGDDPTIEIFPGQASVTLSGTVYMFDEVAQQAKSDLLVAYNDAKDRESTDPIAADLAGLTLTPGVYTSASSIGVTGTLTLDGGGDPNAVFIFQAGSTLTTGSDSEIVLINGAQPCNVFWQVGSSATIGTNSTFVGHILAMESITATTGAVIYGSLLALDGAVTLDSNTITNDACVFASLSVTKVVEGDVDGITLPNFVITVTGPDNYSDTQTIASGSLYTWEGLTPGTYTVSEGIISQEWEADGVGEYLVENGQTTEVTVTNTYTPTSVVSVGGLTVTKVVSGDVTGLTLPDFVISIAGPDSYSDTQVISSGTSYTWSNLTPGAYTVSESRVGLGDEWTVSGESTVQVLADQTIVTTITNQYTKAVVDTEVDEEIKIVDTSDNSGWLTYTGLILLGFGLFILFKWKKQDNK